MAAVISHLHTHHANEPHHVVKKAVFAKPTVQQEFVTINGEVVNTSSSVDKHPSWFELLFDFVIVITGATLVEEIGHTIMHKVSHCLNDLNAYLKLAH